MPTYDYQCSKCKKVQERFHGMSESPNVICANCTIVMTRMIGKGSGVHFKGSGFHCNDYPKEKR